MSADAWGLVTTERATAALLAAIPLSFSKRLRGLMALSLLLNLVLFAAVLAGLVVGAYLATEPLFQQDAAWLAWIGWFVRIALVVGAVFLAPILFGFASFFVLFALREKIFMAAREAAGAPPVETPGGLGVWLRILGTEVRRLFRLLFFSVLILPLNLIPVAGSVVYLVIQYLLAAHTMAWDLMSLHFELHDVPYGVQKRALSKNRTTTLVFGSAAAGLTLVPFAQVLFLTTNVVAAGILSAWMDERADRLV